jgi:predicted outer membrane repeat protein
MPRPRPARLALQPLEDRSVPATFNVTTTLDVFDPTDGKRSLREAITAANNLAGADVIVVPAGVFKVALAGAGEDANLTGDFDVTDTVTIRGAGAGLTAIDGQQLDRVFDVSDTAPGSITVVLEKLTVRNGNVTGHGGGVQVGNANLVVRDAAVTGSRASLTGGGVSNGAAPGTGNVTLVRTTVGRNLAGTEGGGLSVRSPSVLTLKDSTVRRNVAGGSGGGILAFAATLTNSTVSGNAADNGGGIAATTATLTNSTVNGNSARLLSGGGIAAPTANLTNCTVSGNTATTNGGGINATTANLTNSTVSGNIATEDGGGISAFAATLTTSTVSGNTAGNAGGGISAVTATLTNSTVSGNAAAVGGGIAAPTANLTNSTVSGNRADTTGGGINATTATLTDCTVSGNTATTTFGGGISAITATLVRSTVSGNTATTNGGGINATTANLTNSTVSGNSARSIGGGLFATTATLLNCTVVENLALFGGGLFHNPGGTFSVKNTIVALNLVDFAGTAPDVSGAFTSQGHNLIGDGTGGTGFTSGVGDMVGTSVNPIDPKLGALANNGGRTKTHALLAGSRAIDRGDNAGVPGSDQRGPGFPRRKDGNGDGVATVDIGAFEK